MADQAHDPNLERLELLWESDPSSKVYLELAEAYREAGKHEDAVRVLETSLQHRPRDPRGRVSLARCRLDLQDPQAAAALLEDVTRQDPAHVLANKLLLEAYLRTGEAAKAEERLNIYRLLNDRDPELDHLEYRLEGLRSNVAVAPMSEPASVEPTPTEMVEALVAEAGSAPESGVAFEEEEVAPDGLESADSPAFELSPIDPEPPLPEDLETTAATSPLTSAEAPLLATVPINTDLTDPAVLTAAVDSDVAESVVPESAGSDSSEADSGIAEPAAGAETEEELHGTAIDASDQPTVELSPPEESPQAPIFAPAIGDGAIFEMVDAAGQESSNDVATPHSTAGDIFDLGAPGPAPSLDALFDLGANAPAPSLDDLWGSVSAASPEEVPVAPEPVAPEPIFELAAAAEEPAVPEPDFDVAATDPMVDLASPPVAEVAAETTTDELAASAAERAPEAPEQAPDAPELAADKPEAEPSATVTLGELYLSQGHRDEAEKIFRRVLAEEPENAGALDALQRLAAEESESRSESAASEVEVSEPVMDEIAAPEPVMDEVTAPEPAAPEPVLEELAAPEPIIDEVVEPVSVDELAAPEEATAPVPAAAWDLSAAALLADRSLTGVVPEGLTAKKILVLNQYMKHLRRAARQHVR